MTLDESQTMSPTEWGWEIKDGLVFPIYTNAAAAPDELLNVATVRLTVPLPDVRADDMGLCAHWDAGNAVVKAA